VTIAPRRLFALSAAACALLLAFGFYLQYFDDQDPCPLCLVQRGFYFCLLLSFATAAIHAPGTTGNKVYSAVALLFAAGGAGVAGRQVWLQHLPADLVPACGPDLYFMLENLPLARTIEKLFKGSGQCAEVTWRFLSLSIAEWSLLWFVLFGLVALWIALRGARGAAPPRPQ
jgi:protein dithiol:quinone oxidoreductase